MYHTSIHNWRAWQRLIGLALIFTTLSSHSQEGLSLSESERLAILEEPGLTSQLQRMWAFKEQSVAARQLPDPLLIFGLQNVPADNFTLDQELNTQTRLGLRQMFPRGQSRRIRQDIALASAEEMASNSAARFLWVKREVRTAWLDVAYWETARLIVEQDRPLFGQLRDVTASLYETGRKDLQDVVRSELELQRLEDRLTLIGERVDRSRAALARWVGSDESRGALVGGLPGWSIHLDAGMPDPERTTRLIEHPLIQAMDRRVDRQRRVVELAEQNYKPNWMVDVVYGDRQASRPDGSGVPDVWSAWVTIDLPLFTSKRQDRTLQSAQRLEQASVDDRLERLRALLSVLEGELRRWSRLQERKELFVDLILPQAAEQAEAALLSYESDTGDFSEVMRARIFDLDARLDYELVVSEQLKSLAMLRYLIPPREDWSGYDSTSSHTQNPSQ